MRTFTSDRVHQDGSTPFAVQRCCNGCGRVLGDLNAAELRALDEMATGRYVVLPDVRGECPTCNPRPLVGPVKRVFFNGGPQAYAWLNPVPAPSVNYAVPRDTLDPRYRMCTNHHVACDCREAEQAELIVEFRALVREFETAFDEILAGHPTYSYTDTPPCQCTGCRIARAARYYPKGTDL